MMQQRPHHTGRNAGSRRSSRWAQRAIFLVLVGAGVVLSIHPVAETYYNNARGAELTEEYVNDIASTSPASLDQALRRAAAYNSTLETHTLTDPWTARGDDGRAEHDDYLRQLDGHSAMGRLRIPTINVDLPILHGAGRAELALGIGHMYGSSLPVGGEGTHAVLAGHTGFRARVFLDRLGELGPGDLFFIDSEGQTLTYRVESSAIVPPDDLEAVARVPGADLVTLVTCTPDGRLRLLVRGARLPESAVPTTPEAQDPSATEPVDNAARVPVTFDGSVQAWMLPRIALAGGGLIILGLVWLSWLPARRRSEPQPASDPKNRLAALS